MDRNRRLWVDAICISQKDNDEKGPQVALMAQLYRNAESVLVWLGVGNSVIYEAIEILKDAADDAKRYGVKPKLKFHANVMKPLNNGVRQALTKLSNRTNMLVLAYSSGKLGSSVLGSCKNLSWLPSLLSTMELLLLLKKRS